jgi:hypothetical protein
VAVGAAEGFRARRALFSRSFLNSLSWLSFETATAVRAINASSRNCVTIEPIAKLGWRGELLGFEG